MGAPAVIPRTKRHDRSRLTLAERNAIILYSKGAKEAAARALGWTNYNTGDLGPAEVFVERRLAELRDQVNGRRGRFTTRGAAMGSEEKDRLDEREAQPAPPSGEKLDERIEEAPPPPPTPPVREDEPDDAA